MEATCISAEQGLLWTIEIIRFDRRIELPGRCPIQTQLPAGVFAPGENFARGPSFRPGVPGRHSLRSEETRNGPPCPRLTDGLRPCGRCDSKRVPCTRGDSHDFYLGVRATRPDSVVGNLGIEE